MCHDFHGMHNHVASIALFAGISFAHCLSMAAPQIYVGVQDDEYQEYARSWGVSWQMARQWYHWLQSNTFFAQAVFFPCQFLDKPPGVMLCVSTAQSARKGKENGI